MKTSIKVFLLLALITSSAIFNSCTLITDSQEEANWYLIVYEANGKIYKTDISSSGVAFDRHETENHLFLKPDWSDLNKFIALVYDDYKIKESKNPFVSGELDINNSKYEKSETQYKTATATYRVKKYFDKSGKQILEYNPEKDENEFIHKLFPKFKGTRKTSGFSFKKDYHDVTAFLQAKLNKKLRFRIDDENKMLILYFEN